MMFIGIIIWNMFIWAGTSYLVAAHDWSPFWFLVTIALTMQYSSSFVKKEDDGN